MKFTSIALSSAFATTILAAPATTKSGKTLSIPVVNRRYNQTSSKSNAKRDVKEDLRNEFYSYVATIEVGSPAQSLGVALDTGSSDLWVYTPESGVSDDHGLSVTYDSSKSSTYKYLNGDFSLSYVSGSVSGDWVSDNVGLGDVTVKNQQFGTSPEDAGQPSGVFGIGLKGEESTAIYGEEYDNFPLNLVKQGFIDSNAYSLYLDDYEASSGYVLFGGIDKAKYTGDLFDVSLVSDSSFTVDVSVEGKQFQGVLDCGTSYTYLPRDVTDAIAQDLGAHWDDESAVYLFDEPTTKELAFDFGSGSITLPSSELTLSGSYFQLDSGKHVLPICPNSYASGINLLGDTFLRSAYVVYDLDNLKVSLAQSSFSKDSDVIAIAAKK